MSSNAPTLYNGFYDPPLAFAVRWGGDLPMFARDFKDDRDECEDPHRASPPPPPTEENIRFDAAHRGRVGTATLQALLAPREVVLQ